MKTENIAEGKSIALLIGELCRLKDKLYSISSQIGIVSDDYMKVSGNEQTMKKIDRTMQAVKSVAMQIKKECEVLVPLARINTLQVWDNVKKEWTKNKEVNND